MTDDDLVFDNLSSADSRSETPYKPATKGYKFKQSRQMRLHRIDEETDEQPPSNQQKGNNKK